MVSGSDDLAASPGSTAAKAQPAVLFAWGLAAYLVVKLIFLAVLGLNSQYLMDEFDTISHMRFLDGVPYRDSWPPRTLLNVLFYWPAFEFSGDSVSVMRAARAQTIALAFLALGLLYLVARNLGRSRLEGMIVLGITVAFSSHMERAFTVRPEALMLVFALLALLCVTQARLTLRQIWIAGMFCGLAFLTAQKAVYYDLALGLALVVAGLSERSLGKAVIWGAALVAGWGTAFGAYVAFFVLKGADPGAMVQSIFFGASAGNVTEGGATYPYLYWSGKVQTFARNILPYLLCLAGVLLTAVKFGSLQRPERIGFVFSAAIVLLIYGFHPSPWPYNFILAIPFLSLWAPASLSPFLQRYQAQAAFIYMFVFVALALSLARNVHYLGHRNDHQEAVMRTAESLLGPDDRYFDGVFMLPKRQHAGYHWLDQSSVLQIQASAARGDNSALEAVFSKHPKIVIMNYRLRRLDEALAPFLGQSYIGVSPNILLAGTFLSGTEPVAFVNRWPGRFMLCAAEGETVAGGLWLDEQLVDTPMRLKARQQSIHPEQRGHDDVLALIPTCRTGGDFARIDTNAFPLLYEKAHSY